MVNVTAPYHPKTFAFEGSKLLLDISLGDSRILYFWYVLKSIQKIYHRTPCLFVKGSNEKQRRGRIISNFTKGETFSSLNDNQVLLGVISCGPHSCTPQKRGFLQFGQEENIPGHSIETRPYWFIFKIFRMIHIPLSRSRMMSTFIIVSITPSLQR